MTTARAILLAICVGIIWQLVGTFAVEPIVARLTSGQLPDVSQFRSIVGNESQLAFWLAVAWSVGAFLEEIGYRGWILTRCAELAGFSTAAWIVGLVASSTLFGVAHAYQGLSGIIASALSGLVFGGVYFVTSRNLWAAIVAHGVMDTVGFTMMYFGVYPSIT